MKIEFFLIVMLATIFAFLLSKAKKMEMTRMWIAAFLSFALVGPVTYTPDLLGYEVWLEGGGRDLFFKFLITNLPREYLYYQLIHYIFISIYSLTFAFFISRFLYNPFVVIFLFISIVYLHYATQLRFFAAYSLFLVAAYFLMVLQKKIIGFIFFLLAVVNHISILLMIPVILYTNLPLKAVLKRSIILSVFFSIFVLTIFKFNVIPWEDVRFNEYLTTFSDGGASSFLGGLYFLFPSIVAMSTVYFVAKWAVDKQPALSIDSKFRFLFILSLIPVVFLPISLFVQILAQRFVIPSILLQMMFIFYAANKTPRKNRNTIKLIGFSLYCFVFIFQYLVSYYLVKNTYLVDTTLDVLKSNLWIF